MKFFKPYLFFILLSNGIFINAQVTKVDSLKLVVLTMEEDTNKVNTLNTIADLVFRASPDEGIKYGTEAKTLANQLGYQRGLAMAFKNIGLGYFMQANYPEAFKSWEPALELYRELGDNKLVANILSNQASAYYTIGKNVEAIEHSLQALKIAEDLGDSTRIGTLLMTIGLVYSEQPATLDTARSYYLRAIEIGESVDNMGLMGLGSINLGELYLEKKEYDSALHYFE